MRISTFFLLGSVFFMSCTRDFSVNPTELRALLSSQEGIDRFNDRWELILKEELEYGIAYYRPDSSIYLETTPTGYFLSTTEIDGQELGGLFNKLEKFEEKMSIEQYTGRPTESLSILHRNATVYKSDSIEIIVNPISEVERLTVVIVVSHIELK